MQGTLIMMPPIENAEALTSILGHWPGFHDAEVLSLTYERANGGFDVATSIHVFKFSHDVGLTATTN